MVRKHDKRQADITVITVIKWCLLDLMTHMQQQDQCLKDLRTTRTVDDCYHKLPEGGKPCNQGSELRWCRLNILLTYYITTLLIQSTAGSSLLRLICWIVSNNDGTVQKKSLTNILNPACEWNGEDESVSWISQLVTCVELQKKK